MKHETKGAIFKLSRRDMLSLSSVLAVAIFCGGAARADITSQRPGERKLGNLTSYVLASTAGARLDTDLRRGGGTDDSAILQSVLDQAADGRPVILILDGPALVTGLDVHSNTSIKCVSGAGLYLKAGSSRAIIRNKNRSRTDRVDRNIAVEGCFLNGNRWNQPSATFTRKDGVELPTNRSSDGAYIVGLEFLGVENAVIRDTTLFNIRAFGAIISNASRITVENLIVDTGAVPGDSRYFGNTDGIHLKGNVSYVLIDGLRVSSADDGLALNADDGRTSDLTTRNDFGPYVAQGPITDVIARDIQFMGAEWGIRVLSSHSRIDRVVIDGVSGTIVGGHLLNIGHWVNPQQLGNVGTVSVSNVNVYRKHSAALQDKAAAWATFGPDYAKEFNDGRVPFISINAQVDQVALRNVVVATDSPFPILRIGPDARVQSLDAQLTLLSTASEFSPIEIDKNAAVGELVGVVHRVSETARPCVSLIQDNGGKIDYLNIQESGCARAGRPWLPIGPGPAPR